MSIKKSFAVTKFRSGKGSKTKGLAQISAFLQVTSSHSCFRSVITQAQKLHVEGCRARDLNLDPFSHCSVSCTGSHSFFPTHRASRAESPQSCPALCDPVDCSPPGSSVCGILQARMLEWTAMPSFMESSQSRDWTQVSHITQILYHLRHQENLNTLCLKVCFLSYSKYINIKITLGSIFSRRSWLSSILIKSKLEGLVLL